jgi:hypothetical protein
MTRLAPFTVLAALAAASCNPPPRMCAQESDCGQQASCVAGRCVAHGATPAIDSARRVVVAPVDVGYVSRDGGSGAGTAVVLGREGDPAIAFLRFKVPLPPEASVLEAYLVLERAPGVDADPAPITLHAARVTTAWDGVSLSWATQPHVEEVGLPVTRVPPAAGALIRLDVRELVQRWRRRAHDELGVAVLADAASRTGVAFALAPASVDRDRGDPVLGAGRQAAGPRLEVYVK